MSNDTVVSAGETWSSQTITSGQSEIVSGGQALDTVIQNGGSLVVETGVSGGQTLTGSATNITVEAGATVTVSGGVLNSSTVGEGVQITLENGAVNNTSFGNGASLNLKSSYMGGTGTADSDTFASGASVSVASGASFSNGTIDAGASLTVGSGVQVSGTYVDGTLALQSGASFVSGHLGSAATASLSAGTMTSTYIAGTVDVTGTAKLVHEELQNGAHVSVADGGNITDTQVDSGANLTISGGEVDSATIASGASVSVGSGILNSASIESGAVVSVTSGADLQNVQIEDGAQLDLGSSNAALTSATLGSASVLHAGGSSTIESLTANNGAVSLDGSASLTDSTINGGTVAAASNVQLENDVFNSGASVTLSGDADLGSATINGSAVVSVGSDATLHDITVASGATLDVEGTPEHIKNLTLVSGGHIVAPDGTLVQQVSADGQTTDLAVSAGVLASAGLVVTSSAQDEAVLNTYFGDAASGVTISNGAGHVLGSSTVSDISVASGASLDNRHGTVASATVLSGAIFQNETSGTATGLTVASGGTAENSGTVTGLTVSGGVVENSGTITDLTMSDGTVSVVGSGSEISSGTVSAGAVDIGSGATIQNLAVASGVHLDLQDLAYQSNTSVSVDSAGALTVSAGGVSQTIGLGGDFADEVFIVGQDANNDVELTVGARPTLSGLQDIVSATSAEDVSLASAGVVTGDAALGNLTLTVTQTDGVAGTFEQPSGFTGTVSESGNAITFTGDAAQLQEALDGLKWHAAAAASTGSVGEADFTMVLADGTTTYASGGMTVDVYDTDAGYAFSGGTYTVNAAAGSSVFVKADAGQTINGGAADLTADVTSATVDLSGSAATGAATVVSHGGSTVTAGGSAVLYTPGTGDTVTVGQADGQDVNGNITVWDAVAGTGGSATINLTSALSSAGSTQTITNEGGDAITINGAPGANLAFHGQNTTINLDGSSSAGSATIVSDGTKSNTVVVGAATVTDQLAGTAADAFYMGGQSVNSAAVADMAGTLNIAGGSLGGQAAQVMVGSGGATQTIDTTNATGTTDVYGGGDAIDYTGTKGVLVANGADQTSDWSIHGVSGGTNQIWQGSGAVTVEAGGHLQDVMNNGVAGAETLTISGGTSADSEEVDLWGMQDSTQTITQTGDNSLLLFGGNGSAGISASNAELVLNGADMTGSAGIESTGSVTTWVGKGATTFTGTSVSGTDSVDVTGSGNVTVTDKTVGNDATGTISVNELGTASGDLTFIGGARHAYVSVGNGAASITAGAGGLTLSATQNYGDVTLDVSHGDNTVDIDGSVAGDFILNGVNHNTSFSISNVTDQTVSNGNLVMALQDGHTATFVGVTSTDQLSLIS
ncbi:beta strand repeat-containing protein [Acetobacter sp.]|uniref:beta strand repeat-containing protein n=1 Tax=Acetobacter sp. TaxID=440 RepID=UPI0039E9C27C